MKDKRTYNKLKEHGEDMSHENESKISMDQFIRMADNEDRGPGDLTLMAELHQKEIWNWKQKEMEWIKTKNQLDGTKIIVGELTTQIISLKKEIDRLSEENTNLKIITNK
jgi:hypothetical protein|tara:strand:+ start:2024 stop:2353 length:330 start_codon:yes stop_codon:yes gene_type:complete